MRKLRLYITALALFTIALMIVQCLFCGVARAAEEVTVRELVDNMDKYDGQEVIITGEAIGDILNKGDYGWVTVNDDSYSVKSIEEGGELVGYGNYGIGIWAAMDELEDVHVLGGYKNKGDLVKVTGTFNRICHEHGGDTDIHASSIEVLEPGYPISHPFQYGKLLVVLVLAGVIGALWTVRRGRILRALRKA